MVLASGLFKYVSLKRESTYGTLPASTTWAPLRRVRSNFDLKKDTFKSKEIRTSMMLADHRHGTRRGNGQLQGELYAGAYAEIFAAMLKRDFTAGVSTALGATTLAIAGAGPTYTLTRSAGSWITDGFKLYDVARITVGAGLTASNRDKNLMIVALTATVMTVIVLNGSGLATDAATATCTVAVTGKKTYIPTTGHTDYSYALEHWHSDVAQNEVYTGIKFGKADLELPPDDIATVAFEMMGQNLTSATARYSTTYSAANTAGAAAAPNGALIVSGTPVAIITGMRLSIAPGFSGGPVVGSVLVPALFAKTVEVTGQFTAYFENATLRDLFLNETEASLAVALTENNLAASNFVTFALPRIKVLDAAKPDNDGELVQTFPFSALENLAGGTGTTSEASSIVIQDSLAP